MSATLFDVLDHPQSRVVFAQAAHPRFFYGYRTPVPVV
ncbi:hypothetical protein L829_1702 [Mycobacteroides abscessus MAB_030201_1075]|uniref:Uncharacterized protein n=2 Tax=Mycobacteroides abscessus TaxID=36809 RepID=A0A829QNX5_9MYCO|nr:hypothetical protein L829_1702 [Mycobacteroides abscessus MAB_030201_1075]EUA64902.1 hypothetical protein I542_5079 [Mycobacteroides abscessus 1948]